MSSTLSSQSGRLDLPKPGCVGTTMRRFCASGATNGCRWSKPPPPCRNKIGRALPDPWMESTWLELTWLESTWPESNTSRSTSATCSMVDCTCNPPVAAALENRAAQHRLMSETLHIDLAKGMPSPEWLECAEFQTLR